MKRPELRATPNGRVLAVRGFTNGNVFPQSFPIRGLVLAFGDFSKGNVFPQSFPIRGLVLAFVSSSIVI